MSLAALKQTAATANAALDAELAKQNTEANLQASCPHTCVFCGEDLFTEINARLTKLEGAK